MDYNKVDYIVVGLGIAGICFCEQLEKQGKKFIAVDSGKKGATANSGGIMNPTVLKRFNLVWNVAQFYPYAVSFYQDLAQKLGTDIFRETPLLRILNSVEEQNNWYVASDKIELQKYLSPDLLPNHNSNIKADLGFGKVLQTFLIDIDAMLKKDKERLFADKKLLLETFNYDELEFSETGCIYGSISAKAVVFCEGPEAVSNPFFQSEGIVPNKGEFITIEAPQLDLDVLLKGPLYIVPLGDSLYKVGSTFDPDDFSGIPTVEGKTEILSKLKSMINCPFEVVDHTAGVRPTTLDRKPFLGSFRENPNLFFLNGLGTRGLTMAPLLSEILYRNIESGIPIPPEMDINRILG